MARSARLLGNVKPILRLSALSSSPSATYDASDDLQAVAIVDGEGEAITFSERAEGYAPKAIQVSSTVSLASLSLWNILDSNAGRSAVTVVWAPSGVLTPAAGNPVWNLIVTLPARPNLETEQSDGEAASFESTWQIDSYSIARA